MNINGNWNIGTNINFSTALKNKKFTINNNFGVFHRNDVSFFYDRHERTTLKNTTTDTNLNDKLGIAYRNNWIEIMLNGAISYRLERTKINPKYNQEPFTFHYGANFNFILPWGMRLVTNIVNQSRRGYINKSMNRDELIWNALISQSLFKGSATLSVEAYDILQKTCYITRSFNSVQRSIGVYDGINSYVMAHFIYRLNIFGGKMVKAGMMNKQLKKRGIRR